MQGLESLLLIRLLGTHLHMPQPTRRMPLNANYFHLCANCCATFQLSSQPCLGFPHAVPSSIFFCFCSPRRTSTTYSEPFLFVRIIKSKSSAKIEMPFHVHTATSSQKKFHRSFIDFSCFSIAQTKVHWCEGCGNFGNL